MPTFEQARYSKSKLRVGIKMAVWATSNSLIKRKMAYEILRATSISSTGKLSEQLKAVLRTRAI